MTLCRKECKTPLVTRVQVRAAKGQRLHPCQTCVFVGRIRRLRQVASFLPINRILESTTNKHVVALEEDVQWDTFSSVTWRTCSSWETTARRHFWQGYSGSAPRAQSTSCSAAGLKRTSRLDPTTSKSSYESGALAAQKQEAQARLSGLDLVRVSETFGIRTGTSALCSALRGKGQAVLECAPDQGAHFDMERPFVFKIVQERLMIGIFSAVAFRSPCAILATNSPALQ